jgi:hypothetical protein
VTARGEFDTVHLTGYDAAAGACLTSVTLGLPEPVEAAG